MVSERKNKERRVWLKWGKWEGVWEEIKTERCVGGDHVVRGDLGNGFGLYFGRE